MLASDDGWSAQCFVSAGSITRPDYSVTLGGMELRDQKADSRSWDVVRRRFIGQNWNIYYSGGLRRSLEALLS